MRLTALVRILLVSAALAGYSAWVLERRPAEARDPGLADTVVGIPLLRRAEAERHWRQGALFLDVRSPGDYTTGHITGAVNCPWEEFDQRLPALRPRLETARAIVIYCKSVDCGKSLWAAVQLRNEGLTQAVIYPGGWNEWVNAGLPVTRSE